MQTAGVIPVPGHRTFEHNRLYSGDIQQCWEITYIKWASKVSLLVSVPLPDIYIDMCVIDYGPNKMALNFILVQNSPSSSRNVPVFKPSRMKVRINREKPNPIMAPSNVTCLQKWKWKTRRENGASSRWFCLMICLVATWSGQCEFATCLHAFKRDKSGYSKGTDIITSRFNIYKWFIVES